MSSLFNILETHEAEILDEWLQFQSRSLTGPHRSMAAQRLRDESREFLKLFRAGSRNGAAGDVDSSEWDPVRNMLAHLSRSRAQQGFSPSETALFIFSLKQVLFGRLREELKEDPSGLLDALWLVSSILDRLGLFTTEVYQKSREDIIARQQTELMELSTPVVTLWEGILALPLIGTLDSARTQVVMENLLQRVVETRSSIAIIDITGVPVVDTVVAQHLLKTIAAARLMGAECILSGIRPQIAQTIVHLGVTLNDVMTKADLADAFEVALARRQLAVVSRAR